MCGKMAEELLSLKWNNHQAHFVDILTFLREQEIFVDATLACGGKLYAAHKFVLSTCSDYFKQMFTRSPSKHPIVYMKDVTARDLEALLDFMYNGEVNVPQSSLGSLIKTAEGLQIKGLAVPDDPPVPKREREKESRDYKSHTEHSPPAKRSRPRERSPPHSAPSLSHTPSVPRSRSPHHPPPTPSGASQSGLHPVEATLDEDSRTSVHSANSNISEQNSAPSHSSKVNSGQASSGNTTPRQDHLQSGIVDEPSPGPSGIQNPQQSKQEPEVDIKQEDVVDLGEEDEGDWNLEGDGGGGDSSLGSENPNFPEVMLPPADGSMPTSGDPAMGAMVLAKDILGSPPLQDNIGRIPVGNLSISTKSLASGVDKGFRWEEQEGEGLGKGLYPLYSWPSSSNSSIRTSRAIADPESRPYPCPYCSFNFKRRYTLQEHIRIHIGFRPYACRSCGKTFTQRSSLLKHVRVRVCQKHASQVLQK